jgi:hypothetical protein
MHRFFKLAAGIILFMLLISCASFDQQSSRSTDIDEAAGIKYDAWRLDNYTGYEAINVLLIEADGLIEHQNYNAATDKLERVLRISPEYAPAWSRLSWLALQMNSAKRSVQMAKRSNSFAYTNPQLQLLNWSFIRDASQILDDKNTYDRAVQKIELLETF